ncbi:MAG: hypothetical protein KDI46_00985 [Alphaproteobacteria bacterium]|nr:hypothetical protein [Alphaproteobacteria bacterium]
MSRTASWPYYLAGLTFLALYAFWLYWPVDKILIQAHDFLDSIFLYFIARSQAEGFFFNPGYTISIFQDLPLNVLAMRDLGLGALYYELFSPSGAVAANGIVTLFLGFTGFFLLTHDYVLKADKRTVQALLVLCIMALLFATLPFKQQRLAGVSMLPFLFWGSLNLYHGRHKIISFLVFGFYPFVAFLHYNGFAVALAMVLGTGFLVIKRHAKAPVFMALTAFTGVIYCLLEYRSLLVALHPAYKIDSQRGMDQKAVFPDFTDAQTWHELVNKMFMATGHHHMIVDLYALSFLAYALFFSLGAYLFFKKKDWHASYGSCALSPVYIFRLALVAGPVLGLLNFFDVHLNLLQNMIGIPLSLRRLDSFSLPLFLTVLTAVFLSLAPVENTKPLSFRTVFLWGCIVLIFTASFATNRYNRFRFKADMGLPKEFSTTQMVKAALGMSAGEQAANDLRHRKFKIYPLNTLMYTESEYFMPETFEQIDPLLQKALGPKDGYSVMHIGLSPTVGQYHGYRTIDGYFYNYPASLFYEQFWPIIAPEVAAEGKSKDDVLAGGRIYAPLAASHFKDGVITPDYDWCAFRNNGGRAVFSAYEIGNASERGLNLTVHAGEIFVYTLDLKAVCPLNLEP